MMIEGIIYKATNTLNGEVYIGATTQNIEERIQDHYQKSSSGSNIKFHKAINTYGPETFNWEQIDTATTQDELAQKEILHIKVENSYINGYNADKGGGFKKTIYKYNLDGTLNSTFDNLTDSGNSINVKKQSISRACWSVNQTAGGYMWSYEYKEPFTLNNDSRKKAVQQFSLKGNLLNTYVSASEASRITGISKSCITKCCRGERKQSGGYIWLYVGPREKN
ncbi:NUMOD1 domain-containing DNA-binding protein [Flavobacterium chuncheonense]|uniref:NUMOD1 domain-containing DNA-binding protein n=1 Tax=Flavobacterium chuncheonense TaxID=2026653 RepID=A0ABW5YKX0_9FLAO